MDTYLFSQIGSYTIILAVIIGVVRFKKILETYRLFIYMIIIGLAIEIISYISIALDYSYISRIATNFYVLFEYFLIFFLFKRWGVFTAYKSMFRIINIVILFIWVADNFLINTITETNSFFRVCYSTVLVLLSNNHLSRVMSLVQRNIHKNADFIICVTFILYFSSRAVFEVFYFIKAPFSNNFYLYIFLIFLSINILSNLLYAYAMLCLPTKQKFIQPY
jgi:hypothetical protein